MAQPTSLGRAPFGSRPLVKAGVVAGKDGKCEFNVHFII